MCICIYIGAVTKDLESSSEVNSIYIYIYIYMCMYIYAFIGAVRVGSQNTLVKSTYIHIERQVYLYTYMIIYIYI